MSVWYMQSLTWIPDKDDVLARAMQRKVILYTVSCFMYDCVGVFKLVVWFPFILLHIYSLIVHTVKVLFTQTKAAKCKHALRIKLNNTYNNLKLLIPIIALSNSWGLFLFGSLSCSSTASKALGSGPFRMKCSKNLKKKYWYFPHDYGDQFIHHFHAHSNMWCHHSILETKINRPVSEGNCA